MNRRRCLVQLSLIRILLVCGIATGAHLSAVPMQAQDVASLRKQAKEGNAEAQYELAESYFTGTGVSKDTKQGLEWLRKAAEQDHPPAQLALSRLYRNSHEQNIPKDPKQGLIWLRKSADHGYAAAELDLALLYRDGDGDTGIARNSHEAATWFRRAARQPGSEKSRADLEEMVQKGLISKAEANWHAAEPTKEAEKGKAAPFSLVEVETGLKGSITNKRMTTLVQKFGVDFKLTAVTQKRLKDDGAEDYLLQTISAAKRSL